MNSLRVLIVGGGTGGHVYPALAVANELVARGVPKDAVRFIGARRGLEATAVPAAGFKIDLLPGRGIRRSYKPSAWLANLVAGLGLATAGLRALWIVGRWRPNIVFGVGGYASLAGVFAARVWRKPIVIHEPNIAPGLINRWAVRRGAIPTVALAGTPLTGAVLTGTPIRSDFFTVEQPGNQSKFLVTIMGGSLGARRVNDAGLDLYDRWRNRTDIAVRLISGPSDYDRCTRELMSKRHAIDALDFSIIRYEENMPAVYGDSSLIVARSGAVTCAELSATKSAAILIPFPNATDDHQTRNAEALVAMGAAVLLADRVTTGETLGVKIDALSGDQSLLLNMRAASARLAQPQAAAQVADVIERAIRD